MPGLYFLKISFFTNVFGSIILSTAILAASSSPKSLTPQAQVNWFVQMESLKVGPGLEITPFTQVWIQEKRDFRVATIKLLDPIILEQQMAQDFAAAKAAGTKIGWQGFLTKYSAYKDKPIYQKARAEFHVFVDEKEEKKRAKLPDSQTKTKKPKTKSAARIQNRLWLLMVQP